ncbi:MAG: DUF4386 family protein [Ilumatobacter sp.]|nr:DUF4386 family protein [Ilumatobacter sp.]
MTTIQIDGQIDGRLDEPTETNPTWTRAAGFSGIAFVVLFIAMGAGIAASAPNFVDGADELRTWFGDNQGGIGFFTWFGPFVFGFLQLFFAYGLLSRLRTADTSGGIVTRMSSAGMIAQFAAGIVGMSLWAVMSLDPILAEASDGVLLTLSALDSVVFFVLMPWTTAVFVIFASVLIVRSRIMPSWLAVLGVVSGVVPVIGGLWLLNGDPESTIGAIGFIGEFVGMLWIVITSVFLIRNAAD